MTGDSNEGNVEAPDQLRAQISDLNKSDETFLFLVIPRLLAGLATESAQQLQHPRCLVQSLLVFGITS